MALATKCPHCNTIFRVAADQLKLRGGIVRCGSCQQVFDGNSALVEPAAKPTPIIPDVVAELAAPARAVPAISDYVHGTPVDFELDLADESASAAAPARAPATPAPAVWRTAATPAAPPAPTESASPASAAPQPVAEPSPDDAARAAVARAFATVTAPATAPSHGSAASHTAAPTNAAEPAPAAKSPLHTLAAPDAAFAAAIGEPSGAATKVLPPAAMPEARPPAAVPPAATPSSVIDEKLLVWEDIPANASAASDAAAMAAVARAFNHVAKPADAKKAPAPEPALDEPPVFFAKEAAHELQAPSPHDDAPINTGRPAATGAVATVGEPAVAAELHIVDELPAADEPLVVAEPPAADEPLVVAEPPTVEPLVAGQQNATDEPLVAAEPPATIESHAAYESSTGNEALASDEPDIVDDVSIAAELPAAAEPPAVDASPTDDAPLAIAADEAAQETPAEAEEEAGQPAGAALIEAIDQWSADNAHPDGRIEPSLDTPQEHIVLAAIDDAHHFEDLPPAEPPVEQPANPEVEIEAGKYDAADAADQLSPTGEPWSLSEPEPESERDDTALHAVAAVNTDAPDDGESLPSDEEQAKAEADLAAARMRALAGVDEAEDLDHSDLSFVKRVERSQKFSKAATVTMAVGIPLLLAGLALQAGTTFRDTLAANYPQLKPVLAAMCQPLGCKIALPTQLDALSIEQGELATMAENTFSFSTVLRNQSKTAQAWPHIELTLNDNADKPVLRRVFAPREYLLTPGEAEKGFGPRSEQSIKLYFELKELKASGYHIAIFYP
jgi:predicted Zn finger-like uncharacterized protein